MSVAHPDDRISQIADYWFGPLEGGWSQEDRTNLWWYGDEAIDAEIREKFGALHTEISVGDLSAWAASPDGRLAMIIVLDQFSRNLFRGTADAFASDPVSLALCLEAIETGQDEALPPVKRAFLYMPLMHSEDMAHHEMAKPLYDLMVELVDDHKKPEAAKMVLGAKLHKDIIAEFGRYPHRNRALGGGIDFCGTGLPQRRRRDIWPGLEASAQLKPPKHRELAPLSTGHLGLTKQA